MWENDFNIDEVKEIRVKTTVFLGVGAIEKMDFVAGELAAAGISHILCVTGGTSYRKSGAYAEVEKACAKNGISIALYDRVTPNPTTKSIDEAAALGREKGAGAVVCIGGGSPIDAGKSAAVLLANPGHTANELYMGNFIPSLAVPIIAINLTHGTGSEANRFAVASINEIDYKPSIAFDCLYPRYSIDDPALMSTLPGAQTRYVSVDAVNHAIEAATTTATNPLAIELAAQCIDLVARWLPVAEKNPHDLRARYFLAYAALIAGVAFDNGLLHFTHALEHPLSGVKPDLPHGLGLAMILPGVIKAIYATRPRILAQILKPLVPGLEGKPEETETAAKGIEKWLASVGVPQKLSDAGFSEKDIPHLTELAQVTPSLGLLLKLAPVESSPEVIGEIYRCSITPL